MSVSVWLPRLARLAFWLRAMRLWRFLPGPASTLPVAVILNRFLTDDLVFILGILVSFWFALARPNRVENGKQSRPGMPIQARSRRQGRGYSGGGGGRQARIAPRSPVLIMTWHFGG